MNQLFEIFKVGPQQAELISAAPEIHDTIEGTDSLNSKNTTLHCFLKILEENYRRPLGVDYYAEKLFMTTRNLNLICKNILHQTVTETIETRKLIEAKNQLMHSDKNISEIGFEVGYNDKTHFTKVFKRRTEQTPSEFRAQISSLIS